VLEDVREEQRVEGLRPSVRGPPEVVDLVGGESLSARERDGFRVVIDADPVAAAVRERAADAATDVQRVAEREPSQVAPIGRLNAEQLLPARTAMIGESPRVVAVACIGRPILQSLAPRAACAPERAPPAARIMPGWATPLR